MALQRWNKLAQAEYSNTTGLFTWTFPAIPMGFNGLISVSVPTAPSGSQWNAYISGNLTSSFYGASPCGPLFLNGGDVITIQSVISYPSTTTDSALTLEALFSGAAVAVGAIGNQGELDPAAIITGGGVPTGISLTALSLSPTSSLSQVIQLSANARGILILSNVAPTNPFYFSTNYLPVGQDAQAIQYGLEAGQSGSWWAGVSSGDSTFQIEFQSVPGFFIVYEVDYDYDFVESARAMGAVPVTVPNPGAGNDWSYTMPAPGRLKAIGAALYTAAGGGNRFPQLYITPSISGAVVPGDVGDISIPMAPNTVASGLSGAFAVNGWPGAALNYVSISVTETTGTFPLPDMLLPPGSIIQSDTIGLAAGDQWKFIELIFEPI